MRRGVLSLELRRGFSLLELLIVVAIILIIATIAIPSFLRSRQAANESGAIANLRSISTAQGNYLGSNGTYATFTQMQTAGLLDDRFSANGVVVGGYTYAMTGGASLAVSATPSGTGGRYGYYSTDDGVVRYQGTPTPPTTSAAGDPVG